MKVILCYGDSNTWGYDPVSQERLPRQVRWTGVLAQELGAGYYAIEEGLSGRMTVWQDPVEGLHKNGRTYLTPCLVSHQPIDLDGIHFEASQQTRLGKALAGCIQEIFGEMREI